jgi:predicted transposase YbfD/YdcC
LHKLVSEFVAKELETAERSCCVLSLPVGIARSSKSIRHHWGPEITRHWSLDATWREDSRRTMEQQMAEYLTQVPIKSGTWSAPALIFRVLAGPAFAR